MSRAAPLLLTWLVAVPAFAQPPAKLVPREPLASLFIDQPRQTLQLGRVAGQPADAPPWGLIGLPALEGVDLDAPWYVFLSVHEGTPRLSALVPLVDGSAFEQSLLGASDGIGFDRDGDHALVGALPLPATGGKLPAHLPGDAIALRASPSRIVGAFRDDLERFLLESAAQAPRLEAEARGEIYRPPFELVELRETASSAFGTIVAVLEQCTVLSVQLKSVAELVRFDATLGFEPGSEIATALGAQPLARPSRILELDPELPYHQWSNIRLAGSPLLRRLAAQWAAQQSGLPLESAEKLVLDGERVVGIGATFAEREVDIIEWPMGVSLEDYRATARNVHAEAPLDGVNASRRYETDVLRTDGMAVDRLTVSTGTSEPRDALARVESYFGWTGTKLILGASIGDAPEKGLERVSAAASREPVPESALDALTSSIPAKLLWLSRTDAASWDRAVQRLLPVEDRLEPLESRPDRPAVLVYATSSTGTLEIGGWVDSLQQAAMAARLESIAQLAARYKSEALRNEPEEEARIMERAARLGNVDAQVWFGSNHQVGRGVPVDYAKAAFWYRLAAAQGSPDGQSHVGGLYFYALGGERDYEQARAWFEMAAAQGQVLAQYNLGRCYQNGWGVEKSLEDAFEWFSLSAAQDHAASQNELGRAYLYGRGVEKNLDEAERWLTRAAERNYAAAMGVLGDLHEIWRENDPEAVTWFRMGADRGDDYSQYRLALAYERGKGVEQDSAKALELYRTVAEKTGSHQHFAEYHLGLLLQRGEPPVRDMEGAASWYRRAAEGGHASAQLALYYLYRDGNGVPRDEAGALAWLRRAADAQETTAMAVLGWHLISGTGVERDPDRAIQLLTAAADEGNVQAMFWLASAYELGDGVEKDPAESARWHLTAAEKGYAPSQFRLAGQYLSGNGIEQDYVEAYAWLLAAKESDVEQMRNAATELMDGLVKSMSAEQIERGEALAEERRR